VNDNNDDDEMRQTLSTTNDTCIHLKRTRKRTGKTEEYCWLQQETLTVWIKLEINSSAWSNCNVLHVVSSTILS